MDATRAVVGIVNKETQETLRWIAKFIQTLEDGALDPEEAIAVLESLADLCEKVKGMLQRRWWRWVCTAASLCLREGAQEVRRKHEESEE